ncbi:MAG TPA: Fe-S cluster assembly protein SufD [Gammaproteobacteria bacterium]|nr:Fe-S cluster assembly protein SufD [Gammaproteobacteria bacterium]
MTAATLEREIAARQQRLGDAEPWRAAALGDFAAAGLPTPRRENWRYTNLQPLAASAFEWAPPEPDRAAIAAAAGLLEQSPLLRSAARIVLVDGHPVAALSTPPARGIEVRSLRDHWQSFEQRYSARLRAAEHPLAALNTALVGQGIWLRIGADVRTEESLHLVLISSDKTAVASQPRTLLEVGAGASATVVQHLLDLGDPAGWINGVTQIDLAAESTLSLFRLQQHGSRQTHTALLSADLAANAALAVGYVDLGGRLIRNDVDVRLREPGAAAEIFGVFLAAHGQHVDEHTRIDHLARETRSDEAFRGIIGERGRGVFNGKVVVHRDAQRIDARQSSDNLLLGDHAEIDTKPELEIYADDVKCSHGSTVGELDAEQLFYLRSRGVADAVARAILTQAFAASVLERIRAADVREHALALVGASLGRLAAGSAS